MKLQADFKPLHKRFIRPMLSSHAFIYVKLTRVGLKSRLIHHRLYNLAALSCLRIHYIRRESFMIIRYIDVGHRTPRRLRRSFLASGRTVEWFIEQERLSVSSAGCASKGPMDHEYALSLRVEWDWFRSPIGLAADVAVSCETPFLYVYQRRKYSTRRTACG